MKKITLIVSMITLCVGFSTTAVAQASDFAVTSAKIVAPISITKVANMNFGDIAVQGAVAGTVKMDPDGTLTPSTGITTTTATTATAANFTVNGEGAYTYDIALPASVILTDGTNFMTVDAFTSTPGATAGALVGGTETVLVGATLNITAAQVTGAYTNATDLIVTVNYN